MEVDDLRQEPAALPPGKRPGTHRTGCWVGPTAGLGGCGYLAPYRDWILGPTKPVASRYTNCTIPAHNYI
jgi:hypothetical protein